VCVCVCCACVHGKGVFEREPTADSIYYKDWFERISSLQQSGQSACTNSESTTCHIPWKNPFDASVLKCLSGSSERARN
jgi:hypothetical protein